MYVDTRMHAYKNRHTQTQAHTYTHSPLLSVDSPLLYRIVKKSMTLEVKSKTTWFAEPWITLTV